MLRINSLNGQQLLFTVPYLNTVENEDRNKFCSEYKSAIIGLPNFTLALKNLKIKPHHSMFFFQ